MKVKPRFGLAGLLAAIPLALGIGGCFSSEAEFHASFYDRPHIITSTQDEKDGRMVHCSKRISLGSLYSPSFLRDFMPIGAREDGQTFPYKVHGSMEVRFNTGNVTAKFGTEKDEHIRGIGGQYWPYLDISFEGLDSRSNAMDLLFDCQKVIEEKYPFPLIQSIILGM